MIPGHQEELDMSFSISRGRINHGELTSLIPMALDIPVSIHISWLVLLSTSNFNLLETPLRQVHISCSEIASKIGVLQPEGSGEGTEFGVISRSCIADNFDHPVILSIPHSRITIARDFPVTFGHWSGNLMGVEITASLGVDKADGVAVSRVSKLLIWLEISLAAIRVKEPIVVSIFMMITRDLLLSRSFRVGLVVGMEKSAAIAHVLESGARPIRNF